MKRKIKATLWTDLHPDYLRPGLAVFDAPAIGGGGNKYFSCGGGEVEELDECARRIVELWNAAEDLSLTTENITEGEIQKTFAHNQERSSVIEAAHKRIEKLEAEKAEMAVALKTMVEMVEMNGFGKHYALDLARAAIRREEK